MGVYIKGMTMPKTCESCDYFREPFLKESYCYLLEKDIPRKVERKGRMEDCPLSEVELVRCKECMHMIRHGEGSYQCRMTLHRFYNADSYCSYGNGMRGNNETD